MDQQYERERSYMLFMITRSLQLLMPLHRLAIALAELPQVEALTFAFRVCCISAHMRRQSNIRPLLITPSLLTNLALLPKSLHATDLYSLHYAGGKRTMSILAAHVAYSMHRALPRAASHQLQEYAILITDVRSSRRTDPDRTQP